MKHGNEPPGSIAAQWIRATFSVSMRSVRAAHTVLCYGNEFVPYVVLTEKMLNKIQACTYSMDIFNQVAKMTTNYRVWEKVTDYLVQCSDIIADKVENAKAQG